MTVVKCDLCKSEIDVRSWWVTMLGDWGERKKHVDAEARVDLCDECSRNLSNAIESRDTHVRVAKATP